MSISEEKDKWWKVWNDAVACSEGNMERTEDDYDSTLIKVDTVLRSLKRKTTWISVNEQMPEDQEAVLIWIEPTRYQLETEKENHQFLQGAYDKEKGLWYDFQEDKDINLKKFTVTHWLPILMGPK